MPIRASSIRAAVVCCAALLPAGARAEEIDTEHLFGFMIGTDVGNPGEREIQTETTGRFGKSGGNYRALSQKTELEFVPMADFRIELGGTLAAYDISGRPGFDDRRQLSWQGLSLDLRYRLLNRESAPFGLTFAVESHADRLDETTAARVRSFGTEFTLAVDRELVPGYVVAALNLIYQPEWTRVLGSGDALQESTVGASAGLQVQIRPGIFIGGEARYLRRYEGIGLDEFEGQVLYVGPLAYVQLSKRSRLTATWSFQAWGRPAGSNAALDLVNFERHQARLVFGFNF
jgi:hypothetical protein